MHVHVRCGRSSRSDRRFDDGESRRGPHRSIAARRRSLAAIVAIAIAGIVTSALSACGGGGGGARSVPPAVPAATSASTNGANPQIYGAIPRARLRSVALTIHLPLRNSAELDELIKNQGTKDSPLFHHFLTPAQFRARYGATAADLQTVENDLKTRGFQTTITSQGVIASADVATVERTFQTHLRSVRTRRGTSALQATERPVLPDALHRTNAVVIGLDRLPPAEPASLTVDVAQGPQNRFTPVGPYYANDLKQAYRFPSNQVVNGQGRTVAVIGDGDFLDGDVATYFSGNRGEPEPTVVRRPVNGGSPFDPNGDSAETTLDIVEAGGTALGATVVDYLLPDAQFSSFLAGYSAIVEDDLADVVSSSYGLCELYFTADYNGGQDFTSLFNAFHDVFRQGNAQGITFVTATGDRGAFECQDVAGAQWVRGISAFANDSDVTAVGGTNLVTSHVGGSTRSTYVRENAFKDPIDPSSSFAEGASGAVWGSGGGISVYWPRPAYQLLVNTNATMRTVPDVSLHMGGCPAVAIQPCGADRSADLLYFNGRYVGVIGTSAASPEFAGLLAMKGQANGGVRLGNENFSLYFTAFFDRYAHQIFRTDVPGDNGYPAHPGYNYVLGNGTVVVKNYLGLLDAPDAGNPGAPSNP